MSTHWGRAPPRAGDPPHARRKEAWAPRGKGPPPTPSPRPARPGSTQHNNPISRSPDHTGRGRSPTGPHPPTSRRPQGGREDQRSCQDEDQTPRRKQRQEIPDRQLGAHQQQKCQGLQRPPTTYRQPVSHCSPPAAEISKFWCIMTKCRSSVWLSTSHNNSVQNHFQLQSFPVRRYQSLTWLQRNFS